MGKRIEDFDFITQKMLRMWEKNKTAKQIGDELGVTKNAVIGRVTRARMAGLKLNRASVARKKVFEWPSPVAKPHMIAREPQSRCEPLSIFETTTQKKSKRSITLFQLKSTSCRYILNDDPYHPIYCGALKEKISYCSEHYSLCYQVPSVGPRKKNPKKKSWTNYGARGGTILLDG
jgi:hypothetical protein